jgi:hypothetical protein
MKHKICRAASFLVFLSVLLVTLFHLNRIFLPKYVLSNSSWPTTSTYNQFYKMEKDSIDVLFLGSSVAVNAFSPQELYDETEIRSYNLSSEQQSPVLSYYWLKEALRFQSPKAVVLDINLLCCSRSGYGELNMPEGLVRKSMDWMHYSKVKQEAIADICRLDPTQSKSSYIFTNQRFHSRWTELSELDFDKDAVYCTDLKGFSPLSHLGPDEFTPFVSSDTSVKEAPAATMQEYLDRIVSLCREEKIQLILVSTPGDYINEGEHNYMTEYSRAHGVHFIDFCEKSIFDELGADFPLVSPYFHSNILGAEKLTGYIGDYLLNLGISGTEDQQFEATKQSYQAEKEIKIHETKAEYLKKIENFEEYLKYINNEDYSVFISVKEEGTAALSADHQKLLHELGLKSDFPHMFRHSFCAVIEEGNLIFEDSGENETGCVGNLKSGNTSYAVISDGYNSGDKSCIVISGTEYSKNMRGMNFAIYDNMLEQVIDNVNFDTHADNSCHR